MAEKTIVAIPYGKNGAHLVGWVYESEAAGRKVMEALAKHLDRALETKI